MKNDDDFDEVVGSMKSLITTMTDGFSRIRDSLLENNGGQIPHNKFIPYPTHPDKNGACSWREGLRREFNRIGYSIQALYDEGVPNDDPRMQNLKAELDHWTNLAESMEADDE